MLFFSFMEKVELPINYMHTHFHNILIIQLIIKINRFIINNKNRRISYYQFWV